MTAEEVLKSKLTIESMRLNNSDYTFNKVIEAMELYAEIYHQRKVKILNIPCVIKSVCECEKQIPNYPEMLWCNACGKWIK